MRKQINRVERRAGTRMEALTPIVGSGLGEGLWGWVVVCCDLGR